MTHEHGPGKRWEGDRYTCTECRRRVTITGSFGWPILAETVAAGTFEDDFIPTFGRPR